jgi:quercetin dioxygenase-like cupin family protein
MAGATRRIQLAECVPDSDWPWARLRPLRRESDSTRPPTPTDFDHPSQKVVDMSSRILTLAAAALLGVTASSATAQNAKLTWGPAPPFLPAGAQFALVSGDPGKAGHYEIQLSLPSGYIIPPHSHPTDETVTVKSGHFRYGMGDKIDAKSMKTMNPGQSGTMPARQNHYARAQGHTVVAVSGTGPFAITYVNPADDPRTKPMAKGKAKVKTKAK